MTSTPDIDWSSFVAAEHAASTAPKASLQGTGLPGAGTPAAGSTVPVPAQVAYRARVTALPGLPARGAPV